MEDVGEVVVAIFELLGVVLESLNVLRKEGRRWKTLENEGT
jgi:hypothetical protein